MDSKGVGESNLKRFRTRAFTLVEILVAIAVLGLIMVFVSQIVNNASSLLKRTQGGLDAFQESRAAFQQMTSRLSQATLNPSWSYNAASGPTGYSRTSTLQFVWARPQLSSREDPPQRRQRMRFSFRHPPAIRPTRPIFRSCQMLSMFAAIGFNTAVIQLSAQIFLPGVQ